MEYNYNSVHRNFMYMINDKPTKVNGVDRWAMLQIDCNTYETISVLDDGGNSAMVEFLLTYMKETSPDDYLGYICGAMVGVSVGVWSMSAASLLTDDYEEIVEIAAAYAGYTLEKVKQFFDLWGASKDLAALAGGQGNASGGPFSGEGKINGDGSGELKVSLTTGGPAAGFEAGLEYYFKSLGK